MKIILLQDIRAVGKKNDIKTVSDGYAHNFLFPKKFAIPATLDNKRKRHALIAREEHALVTMRENATRMEKEIIPFTLKTGAHGAVFNSITKNDIAKALAEKGYAGITTIDLHTPIKKIGTHVVVVHFEQGIAASVTINAQ